MSVGKPTPSQRGGAAVPDEKRAAFQILVDRVLRGPGETTTEQRAEAFENPGADPLLGKVATDPTEIADADFAAARSAGLGDDQVFELVIAAAVGQATRMYDAALAALDEAAG